MINTKGQTCVSVIMNCYNGEKYLNSAIDSIYNQTYLDWEIIFWDNASKDKSSSIALSYDSKLKYFKSKKTLSLGKARNKALSKCLSLACLSWRQIFGRVGSDAVFSGVGLRRGSCCHFNVSSVWRRPTSKHEYPP